MTKWQTRQALYLLGLTGILYLFSCKSQAISLCRNKVHRTNDILNATNDTLNLISH